VNERWVCKRCFADNEETSSSCRQCGLIRGAEASPADHEAWASRGGALVAVDRPRWRRWLRFWWIPVLAIALGIGYLSSARRDEDGALASAGNVSVDELREGDCFTTGGDDEISDVDGVPCTEVHEYEVFAHTTYEGDGTYPPDSQLPALFTQVCEPEFEPYVGTPYATSEIFGSMITPSEDSWGSGDRSFICVLYDPENAELTESLAGAAR